VLQQSFRMVPKEYYLRKLNKFVKWTKDGFFDELGPCSTDYINNNMNCFEKDTGHRFKPGFIVASNDDDDNDADSNTSVTEDMSEVDEEKEEEEKRSDKEECSDSDRASEDSDVEDDEEKEETVKPTYIRLPVSCKIPKTSLADGTIVKRTLKPEISLPCYGQTYTLEFDLKPCCV
jgi:hypothetical protein